MQGEILRPCLWYIINVIGRGYELHMEEIIKNPLINYLIGAIVFLTQLFLRSKLNEVKRQDEKTEKSIEKLFERTDKISAIETDLKNLRDECRRNHA
jgi:hypothetical protein